MKRDDNWEARLRSGPFQDGGLRPEVRAAIRERTGRRRYEREQVGLRRYRQAAIAVLFALLIGGGALYAANQPELWEGMKPGGPDKLETLDANEMEPVQQTAGEIEERLLALEEPIELKVLQGLAGDFMRRHGSYFETTYPQVSLKATRPVHWDGMYMTFTLDDLRTYIQRDQPDLVSLSLSQYEALADEGLLLPLAPFAQRDGFDLTEFHPAVMDVLREAGGGSVRGLTEQYYANLIFVREKAFREAGLPVPEAGERMSWKQLLEASGALYAAGYPGLIAGYPDGSATLVEVIAGTEGVELFDPATGKANIATEEWRAIWQAVVDGVGSGAIFQSRPVEKIGEAYVPGERRVPNPLSRGEGALYYGNAIAFLDAIPADERSEWRALPAPGEGGRDLYLGEIYAIPKTAVHPDAAWALLKVAMGDANPNDPEQLQWYYRLYAHLGKAERVMGKELVDALRVLKVDPSAVVNEGWSTLDDTSRKMFGAYATMSGELMKDILQGGWLTVEEALLRIQRQMERAARE